MDNTKDINKLVLAKAKKYRNLLEANGVNISAFYIFGSHAQGTAKPWSDIDIGVVSPDFTQDRITEGVKLDLLGDAIDSSIEPHPFLPEEFSDKYYPLAQEIKKTGIKI
ncbi:MAG: Nucleotidyltransferase [Berkelbacteria bacterium GW2011_GWA2_35_9]|uniref:Nucleotidyltransferase n=1 Tax=Berkelbacteria bacterium GW2011_GWA2_35_9 TaxID=1618333 RepID=A0A0G0DHJ1_9BACT|nr:MAG: Nucleotidyltransferase [Berkelbacteria bacterium GW2011_GWA2_35_9]